MHALRLVLCLKTGKWVEEEKEKIKSPTNWLLL